MGQPWRGGRVARCWSLGRGGSSPPAPAVPPSLASSGSDTHSSLSEHVGVFLLQGLAL